MGYKERIKKLLKNEPQGELPNRDIIARSLNVSERTLARKLQLEDTTFKQLIDNHLMTLSLPYVMSGKHSIEDISAIIGYRTPDSFIKAFYRWTGDSPTKFRNKNLVYGSISAYQ